MEKIEEIRRLHDIGCPIPEILRAINYVKAHSVAEEYNDYLKSKNFLLMTNIKSINKF
jgi:hypothetical protein